MILNRIGVLFLLFVVLSACTTMPGEPQIFAPTLSALNESLSVVAPTAIPAAIAEPEATIDVANAVVTIWHSLTDDKAQALYEISSTFQEQHAPIKVRFVYIPYDDLRDQYSAALDSGNGPNLLIAPGEWGHDLFSSGKVMELSGLISNGFLARINPAAIEMALEGDRLVGMPFSLRGVVMYRNALIIPNAPVDFNILVASARNATRGRFIGAYLDRGGIFGLAQSSACGIALMNETGSPSFNNEAGLCWLDLLRAFEDAGPVTFDSEDDSERFSAGRIGIIIDGTWKLEEFKTTLGDNLAIDPWPAYQSGRLSGYVWTDSIYMNADLSNQNQRIAWTFVDYLLTQETQKILSEFGHIPAGIDVSVDDLHMQQVINALTQGTAFPTRPGADFLFEPLNSAMMAVLEDGVDPIEALQAAHDHILALIANNR